MLRGSPAPRLVSRSITWRSEERLQIADVTDDVRGAVAETDVREGVVIVNSRHTTCALLVNEFQGALMDDLKSTLERLVPHGAGYRHDDPRHSDCERGNAAAHLQASLVGRSVAMGVSGGEVALGRFQSILLVELDGPRCREIDVQVFGV
jgi:secondary thiamine-phosphate synthase enzyme